MPLTEYQAVVARLLSGNRTFDSYLAGGAAILIEPNTTRYSRDLDYFQDSEARVAEAFAADRALLVRRKFAVDINQPGTIRAVVSKGRDATKVEWARDVLDAVHLHRRVLVLGALCWAACGKDPGFTPLSLLDLLRRRGRVREEDLARLDLTAPIDSRR